MKRIPLLIGLCLLGLLTMGALRITSFDAITSLPDTGLMQVNVAGVDKKITCANLAATLATQTQLAAASNTVASSANSASNVLAQAALLGKVAFFVTNEVNNASWATNLFNASNCVAGLITVPPNVTAAYVTNNLVTTNTAVAYSIQTPLALSNLTVSASANLLTFGFNTSRTNCLVGWRIWNAQ